MSTIRPYRAVAIFARMRTGSNLLERSLGRHPDTFTAGELFNRAFISTKYRQGFRGWTTAARDIDPMGCLDVISADDPRLLIFRIFPDHMPDARADILTREDVYKVILKRPYLESFLSLEIARTTDQWLLGKHASKVDAPKVTFCPESFLAYRKIFADQDADLRATLRDSGQMFSEIAYHDLQNVNALNQLAGEMGLEPSLTRFVSPIDKQNAENVRDLVANPEALAPYMDDTINQPFTRGTETPIIGRVAYAKALDLVFCPILGNATSLDYQALTRANDAPLVWINTNDLKTYPFAKPPVFFTRFLPPLERAYLMFHDMMDGTLTPWAVDPFDWLTQRAKARFPELPRPYNLMNNSLKQRGYTLKDHKRNFLFFLREIHYSLWINSPQKLDDGFLPQLMVAEDFERHLPEGAAFDAIMGWENSLNPALRPLETVRASVKFNAPFPYVDVIGPNHVDQIYHLYGEDLRQLPFALPQVVAS